MEIDRTRIEGLTDLTPERLQRAKPDWALLGDIRDHYLESLGALEPIAQMLQATLRRAQGVHSVFYRIKDPDHLLAKIIRKQADDADAKFTVDNYAVKVTDLVGVRVLHLFKEDWTAVHDFIMGRWDQAETPTAKIRKGDLEIKFSERKCRVEEHPAGYRSVHYLLSLMPTKAQVVAEIQVRTVFEEAWGEIDHSIRYPHNRGDAVLNEFLQVFNRFAGSADEMGSFIRALELERRGRSEAHRDEISKLKAQVARLKIDAAQKASIVSSIDSLNAASDPALSPMLGTLFGIGKMFPFQGAGLGPSGPLGGSTANTLLTAPQDADPKKKGGK